MRMASSIRVVAMSVLMLLVLAGALPALASVGYAGQQPAAGVESSTWAYQQNGDLLPNPDFTLSGPWTEAGGGILNYDNGCLIQSDPWLTEAASLLTSGYTVEVRMKVGTPGGMYGFGIAPADGAQFLWVNVLPDGVAYVAGSQIIIDTHRNDDGAFHVFRVAHSPGASTSSVWRDGVLLTTSAGLTPYSALTFLNFGEESGTCGSGQLDYVRWTPGVYNSSRSPVNVSLTPVSGAPAAGTPMTFTQVVSDPNGFADISRAYLLLNDTDGQSNAAFLCYDRASNRIYLKNDAGTSWSTGYAPGTNVVLQNSQCYVYVKDTTVSGVGNNLTLNWRIALKTAFAARSLNGYVYVQDMTGMKDGWDQMGRYFTPAAPTCVSVTPSTGSVDTGVPLVFSASISDSNGYPDIGISYLQLSVTSSAVNGIYLLYDSRQNKLFLRNDTSTSWGTGYAPGANVTLENSQCTVDVKNTTVTPSGANGLVVNWNITLKLSQLTKRLCERMFVRDRENLNSGWKVKGYVQVGNPPLLCEINSKIDNRDVPWTHWGWQKHAVVRLNGSAKRINTPAQLYFIGGEWPYSNSQMPYLVYMPEISTIMMAAEVGPPSVKTVLTFSADSGATWTAPRWMHTNASGTPDLMASMQMTYLGNGKLISSDTPSYWFSSDYGQSFAWYATSPLGSEGKPMYNWAPMLVDRDPITGDVTRIAETRYKENGTFDTPEYFSQACIRFSEDEGRTWSTEINVPQWKGLNEVVLSRAKNGDIVAAGRTDNPVQFLGLVNDQYSGLATSVSSDNGYTWTELYHLYFWGRHHPNMVVMPSGDIVMTYVVRNGYTNDNDGFPRFGIEAVVSKDNGKTWDLDHKYILASYSAQIKDTWWGSTQSTTNVLLPDGYILTAFGTGVRNLPTQSICKMDVAMVKWKPSGQAINTETTLRDALYESDLRNKFDLYSVK